MASLRGLLATTALFIFAFALHIVGGAADSDLLFGFAVVLIFAVATGFPWLALTIARVPLASNEGKATAIAGLALGSTFTLGALWAANDRAFAAWHWPAALALVLAVSLAASSVEQRLRRLRKPEPAPS